MADTTRSPQKLSSALIVVKIMQLGIKESIVIMIVTKKKKNAYVRH
jgi:hypothetical protein